MHERSDEPETHGESKLRASKSSLYSALNTMPKTNQTTIKSITEYKSANDSAARNRDLLTTRLKALYEDGRRIEEEKHLIEVALSVEPAPASEVSTPTMPTRQLKRTRKARKTQTAQKAAPSNGAPKKGPSGEISPAIFAFVLKHPGAKSAVIREKVRIDGKNMVQYAGTVEKAKMTIGTALNAMKKHGYLRVKGTRSNYGYHAVT